jgi:hypothetical protein
MTQVKLNGLVVYAGSADDARDYAAGLIQQVRDNRIRKASDDPTITDPAAAREDIHANFAERIERIRTGRGSITAFGPEQLVIRVRDGVA